MRKMKKIITLAMTLVMMMAMSITAFATESGSQLKTATSKDVTTSTITITNISTREASAVTLYQLAHVDFTANTVTVNQWAENVYKADTTDFTGIKSLLDTVPTDLTYGPTNSVNGQVVVPNLPAGVYYASISGTKYTYNPMVILAYGITTTGYYAGISDATAIAKGSTSNIEKSVDEEYKFVAAGTVVPFTIETNIPYEAESFVVFDESKNLTLSETAKVTIVGVEGELVLPWADAVDKEGNVIANTKQLDLTDYLDYKNAAVTITYTGKVGKAIALSAENGYSYENSAYTNTNGTKDTEKGFTGELVINKFKSDAQAANGKSGLDGATFIVKDATGTEVKFDKQNDGTFVYDAEAQTGDALITANGGIIHAAGLPAGAYTIEEVAAPTGYTVNTVTQSATISADPEKNVVISFNVDDPDLIQLPFTGGMGTTIFTILGVAIMAMAAALFFATKKSR